MLSTKNRVKWVSLMTAAAAVLLLGSARQAAAVGESCQNDDDCPNPACGGEVCDWPTDGLKCRAAGRAAAGSDGWCMDDTDCKCKDKGATCNTAMFHCTFTVPPASGTGGASGTASGGASGTGSGGASGTASGGSSGTSTGGAAGPKDSGGGGCTVAGSPASGVAGTLAGIALLGLAFGARSRRRRG